MEQIVTNTEARERVLQVAERLFAQKGYTAVTLRDIAAELGLRHASLYYHVPGGKEELFVEVTERYLKRHRDGLTEAIEQAEPNIRMQLRAIASWLLSQPPMDLLRMVHSDLPAISALHADRLSEATYAAILGPIQQALRDAYGRGEVKKHDFGLVAGGVLGMIESLHAVPTMVFQTTPEPGRREMARALIDVVLNGIVIHPDGA